MQVNKLNNNVYSYMRDNSALYIFSTVLFIMGVVYGSLIIKSLSYNQEQELINYLSDFFYNISIGEWQNSKVAFQQILFDDVKYLLLIWFLGLSIIGMPIIFLIIFMKGLVVGFTISFLISELGWKGFLFSLFTIVPQNLLIVPAFIIAGVAGTLFSLSLIKNRASSKIATYQQSFISYTLLILLLGGVIVIASAYEAFVSPYLMQAITTNLLNP